MIIICFLSIAWFQCCISDNQSNHVSEKSTEQRITDSLAEKKKKEAEKALAYKQEEKEMEERYQKMIDEVIEAKKNPQNPFKQLKYHKAVLYQFDDGYESMFREGSQTLIPMQDEKVMDASQVRELVTIVGDTSTYGNVTAACFMPRHGVIFYDKKEKPIASITICFSCNFLESAPFINVTWFHSNIQSFDGKRTVMFLNGFSKKGRQRLMSLFFNKCGLKSPFPPGGHSMFDK